METKHPALYSGVIPFETLAKEYHNEHRRIHKAPELQLDHELSLQAARFAQEIVEKGLKHSTAQERPNQGENIALGCRAYGKGMSAFEAVKEWFVFTCFVLLNKYWCVHCAINE